MNRARSGASLLRGLAPPLRTTLGLKLALVLVGVVLGALVIVYLLVVPRLEERLVDAKVRELERAAPSLVAQLQRSLDPVDRQDTLTLAAANLNARIVVFQRLPDGALLYFDDSAPFRGTTDMTDDPVALEAAATLRASSGRVERDEREFAQVGIPLGSEVVVLLAAPLEDVVSDVRLVRRSLVVAGLVALLASGAAAYLAALGLTRRLRRLEAAADRIASGDFRAPVEPAGTDEIGQLGRSFDSMRARLADVDRVRREFIANASHELRTPLFALGGFLELLTDDDLDAETRHEFLAETRTQVERLTRLATDLLDLSRLDAGHLHVERGEAELAAAARTVAEEFRAVAEASDHPLSVSAVGEVPACGDHERVVQIARVLLENALRHTPPGTPVAVVAEPQDGRAALAVRDEGPGIAPEEQERVFQRFYRAGGGQASGSGLGLAIASELATRMGGSLRLVSAPGETTFTLELPATNADAPVESPPPAAPT